MRKKITFLFVAFLATAMFYSVYAINDRNMFAAPSNDDCSNATTLTVNSNYICTDVTSGTVFEATASAEPSGCTGTSVKDDDDVWFKFVATATSHRISLLNIAGDFTNLFHTVYDGGVSGDCNALNALICSDPEVSNLSGLTVGNTYFIRVYTNSTANNHNTTFDICIGTEPAIPANDACDNAEEITAIPFSVNTDASGATNNAGFINPAGCGSMNDGVWYKIVGDGNQINVTVIPTGWDVEIGVYTGSCGTLVCEASVNTGISGTAEGLNFVTTLGTDYFINIGNASDAVDEPEGIFTMNVSSTVLSIDELIAKGFTYYPNPVENRLQLEAKEEIKHLAVYNAFGQQLRLFSPSSLKTNVDLSTLPTGAYFIRAYVGDGVGVFKVLKN